MFSLHMKIHLGPNLDVKIYKCARSASEILDLHINPELPIEEDVSWMAKAPAAAAGLSGVYYRTLLQGTV